MSKFLTPKTYLIGYTTIALPGLTDYLLDTDNVDFLGDIQAAKKAGLSDGEILCSFYAKLCYKSLTEGKNNNIVRIRSIENNLRATVEHAHGAVFEHAMVNFVTTNCSRVFTHECVRNRVGMAYSQTSGRYVRIGKDLEFVHDPILDKCDRIERRVLEEVEKGVYLAECEVGLRVPPPAYPDVASDMCLQVSFTSDDDDRDFEKYRWVPNNDMPFAEKKRLTSAIRRMAPNGISNELGWSMNLRSARHIFQLRTSEHAEWEIRLIMNQAYELMKKKFPLLFFDAKEREVDGLKVIYGMKTQPYEENSHGN